MMNISDMYRMNPRHLTREQFKTIRSRARRLGFSYRVGCSYVGRYGIEPCDNSGNRIEPRASKLNAAQWARKTGLRDAARRILGME